MADFTPVTQLNEQAQAGWDAQQAEARKAAAYNALRKTYGDIAGDPTSALAMQKYGFDQQNNPLLIQQNELQNNALSQKNSFDAQQDPLLLEHQALSNTGQGIANENNQTISDKNKLDLQTAHAAQLHGVLSGSLNTLTTDGAGITDPTQRGALFDKQVAAITPLIGGDPQQIQQQLAAERQKFVEGGVDAIPGIQSDLDAAVTGMMTPKDRAALATQQARTGLVEAQTDKAKAGTAAANAKAAAGFGAGGDINKNVAGWIKANGKPDAIQAAIASTQTFDQKLGIVLGDGATAEKDQDGKWKVSAVGNNGLIGNALTLSDKVKGMSPAQIAIQSKIPGTDAFQLQQTLDQIGHSTALTDLQNIRASGLSLGRVTNTEFQAASQAIINPSVMANPARLKGQLYKLADLYYDTHDAATQRIKSQQGALDQYHAFTKGTIYDTTGGYNPSGGLAPPAGATPPGAAAPGQPGAAAPVNPATMTPQQLQQQLGPAPGAQPISDKTQQPQAPQPGQVGTAPDGTPIVQASAPVQQPAAPTLPPGQRLIPNFVAAPTIAPLQQALSDPSARAALPAGMRNNNPGNIKYVGQRGTTPSQNTDEGDPQAVYPTPQAGLDAMSSLLGRKFNGGKTTADQLIAAPGGWTPGNHQAAANVAKTMGIGPNDQVNLNDPVQKAQFMRALMLQEHGPKSRLYPDSMIMQAAGAPSGPGNQPSAQPTVASAAPAAAGDQQVADATQQPAAAGGQMMAGTDANQRSDAATAPAGNKQPAGSNALATMTPTQVATMPVTLPSALDLRVGPQGTAPATGGAAKLAPVLGDAHAILAHYGLARRATA